MTYIVYYTSKNDMFVVTIDNGTLHGKYDTDIFCKNEKMANKVCNFLNKSDVE